MARKSSIACWVEYAALRAATGFVNAIPYGAACLAARCLAWTAFRVAGFNRKRTLARIRGCFPEKTAAEASRIAVASLANVLVSAVEMIRAPRLDRKWIEKHVKDAGRYAALLKEFVDEGKGVVIMVPHSGNWYMAAWAMAAFGIPLFALAAKQRNPLVNAWMRRQYGTIDVLERGDAATLRDILGRLRQGRAFAILPDLRVPAKDVEVPFFNGTANVSHAGALFAVQAGSPVVVAVMRRERGKHVFDYLGALRPDPAAPDKKEEARRLTREALALIDASLKKTPEQWFWFNKRWLLQPVG